jgi:hypothetical protein
MFGLNTTISATTVEIIDTFARVVEWHTLSINEIETRLSTSLIQRLSKEQVELKQKEFGKNTPSKAPSDLFSRVMGYMFGGFGFVLLIGGILVTITYKPLGNLNPQIVNWLMEMVKGIYDTSKQLRVGNSFDFPVDGYCKRAWGQF